MTFEYLMGLLAGIVVIVVLLVIVRGTKKQRYGKSGKPEYDERQLRGRGVAYQTAYFTLMISLLVHMLLEAVGVRLFAGSMGVITCVVISLGVFVCRAIRLDAYLAFNENIRRWYVLDGLILAANLLSGIASIRSGELIRDGQFGNGWISLLIAGLWAVIMAAMYLHSQSSGEEFEEE